MAAIVEMLNTLRNGQRPLLSFEAKLFDMLTGGNVHAMNTEGFM
jgi:hypothetical protein